MPHHCIVPLCTNNSVTCDLHFYRLPVNKPELLKKWLVAIKRENMPVHGESRVCSAHFEGNEKSGANDVPSIFAWTKKKKTRLPPKECHVASCVNPEQVSSSSESRLVCSIGISADIHPDNHVSTSTDELFKISHTSKVVSVCPVVEHVAVNNDFVICKDVSTETVKPVASKETMVSFGDFAAIYATQTVVSFSHLTCNEKICNGVVTMAESDYFTPFRIEQI